LGAGKFRIALRTMFFLALSRTTGPAYRANSAHSFLNFLLKIQSAHGSKFTVKWLKAGYVAIQKELGNDGMKSLRVLDPELPLPALASRLPRVIPATSWAMLAFTHHWIVQYAAYQAGVSNGQTWYSNYEILGDEGTRVGDQLE
jgi:hypothetical protein